MGEDRRQHVVGVWVVRGVRTRRTRVASVNSSFETTGTCIVRSRGEAEGGRVSAAPWFYGVWGRPARRLSERGHDGGWRLRVASVTNCETADRFIGSASPHAAAPGSLAGLPLSNGGGSMGRGRSREAARGSARAGTLGHGVWQRTPGSSPGTAGGPSEKRTAGRVQGFQLP